MKWCVGEDNVKLNETLAYVGHHKREGYAALLWPQGADTQRDPGDFTFSLHSSIKLILNGILCYTT